MRRARVVPALLAVFCGAALCVSPSAAWAKSWCARPVVVHEWGVQVFDAKGDGVRALAPGSLPAYFHAAPGPAGTSTSTSARVSDLPPDGGERDLPVLHFYAGPHDDKIPLGLGVGFSAGAASRWYPQVDVWRAEVAANSAAAQSLHAGLEAARAQLKPYGAPRPRLPDDPTHQLQWSSLVLSRTPTVTPHANDVEWIRRARAFTNALWVNGKNESERFVFFEGKTREHVALAIKRGDRYRAGFRHYVLTNTSAFAVHDVLVVHREGNALYVFAAPAIPAGATAGFALEEHRVAAADANSRTRGVLRERLVANAPDSDGACVMERDPAVPVATASNHTLTAEEADTLLDVWGAALFDQTGTTIVYREDRAYLDRAMPLAIFTDMFHWVKLHRAGLALWRGVALP